MNEISSICKLLDINYTCNTLFGDEFILVICTLITQDKIEFVGEGETLEEAMYILYKDISQFLYQEYFKKVEQKCMDIELDSINEAKQNNVDAEKAKEIRLENIKKNLQWFVLHDKLQKL